jgi:predicted negative regulator of RcsB-dependent stress response
MKWIVIFILCIVLVAGYKVYQRSQKRSAEIAELERTCGDKATLAALEKLRALNVKISDQTKVAASTARIALAPQVSALQSLVREVEQVKAPPCAIAAQRELGSMADFNVTGLLAFMRQEEKEAALNLGAAQAARENFETAQLKAMASMNDTKQQIAKLRN